MNYKFTFCDDNDRESGVISAETMHAAIVHILSINNRFETHKIKEHRILNWCERLVVEDNDNKSLVYVEVRGDVDRSNPFLLDVKLVGSHKRIPLRFSL